MPPPGLARAFFHLRALMSRELPQPTGRPFRRIRDGKLVDAHRAVLVPDAVFKRVDLPSRLVDLAENLVRPPGLLLVLHLLVGHPDQFFRE